MRALLSPYEVNIKSSQYEINFFLHIQSRTFRLYSPLSIKYKRTHKLRIYQKNFNSYIILLNEQITIGKQDGKIS